MPPDMLGFDAAGVVSAKKDTTPRKVPFCRVFLQILTAG
jgi:hypothetical protein